MTFAEQNTGAPSGAGWSDDMKEKTRSLIRRGSNRGAVDDLYFKKDGRTFGMLRADDLASGRLIIRSPNGATCATFAQVEDLISAGWVVD